MSKYTYSDKEVIARFLDDLAQSRVSISTGTSYGAEGSVRYWGWWSSSDSDYEKGNDVGGLIEYLDGVR